jgi:ATP-citrate lyase alpha-subunit
MAHIPSHYAVLYGNHLDVAQRMLDYDYICGRDPSIKAIMVNDAHPKRQKVFFGNKEIYIPQVNAWDDLIQYQPFDMLINFASYRTAPSVVMQALESRLFAWIFTVAEGIPERDTREIIAHNADYGCRLIGPSSVGGIFAGSMRVGNT